MTRTFMPSALTLAMLAVTNAHAADVQASATAQLPEIVVTASKTAEDINLVPARIAVIDNKTIQQSPVQSLGQLLQQDAALNVVQSGGIGQQTSLFTRGTNSNHTLVLEDGARLNTGSQSSASIPFIDLSDVSRIEVLKGPASVQYGTDAIGGVVQLINEVPKKQHAFATIEAGEQSTYKAVAGADLVQDDAYFQVRGQRLESDGSPVTNTPNAPKAGYNQEGYSAKWGIDNKLYAFSTEFKENKGNNQYDLSGSPTSQDFFNRLIQVKGRYNINDQLVANARYSYFEDQLTQKDPTYLYDYSNWPKVTLLGQETDYTNTFSHEGDLNLQWHFTPAQNILVGATGRWTEVESLNNGTQYDKSLNTVGYYLQHQYQANGLSTQAGVRVEDNQQFGTHTVGQFGARYQLLPATSLYANVGSAFKAPSGNDLYGFGGNPQLKPEDSLSYEVGVDQQLLSNLKASLSVYQTKVRNLISFNNQTFTAENIDKAKMTGGEFGLKYTLDNWFTSAEFAYVNAKNETTQQQLLRRPHQTATLTAGWDNHTYGVSASLVAKGHAKDFADYPSKTLTTTPGHVTGNINLYWQASPYMKLFANVQNIGDTKYKTAYDGNGVYYIGAPRLATAGVTFSY